MLQRSDDWIYPPNPLIYQTPKWKKDYLHNVILIFWFKFHLKLFNWFKKKKYKHILGHLTVKGREQRKCGLTHGFSSIVLGEFLGVVVTIFFYCRHKVDEQQWGLLRHLSPHNVAAVQQLYMAAGERCPDHLHTWHMRYLKGRERLSLWWGWACQPSFSAASCKVYM